MREGLQTLMFNGNDMFFIDARLAWSCLFVNILFHVRRMCKVPLLWLYLV